MILKNITNNGCNLSQGYKHKKWIHTIVNILSSLIKKKNVGLISWIEMLISFSSTGCLYWLLQLAAHLCLSAILNPCLQGVICWDSILSSVENIERSLRQTTTTVNMRIVICCLKYRLTIMGWSFHLLE